jgi:hypothetical protein
VNRFTDPSRYDAILIDLRAGLHETAASGILGLGAEVLLFGLDEPQTFHGYSALLAHMQRLMKPEAPSPEWLDRLTMVHGKASRASEDESAVSDFADKCRMLFMNSGLISRYVTLDKIEPYSPAEPFNDVPWEEDEDTIVAEESEVPNEPLVIFEDTQFRHFQPLKRRDLISKHVYEQSYGTFLSRLNIAFDAQG